MECVELACKQIRSSKRLAAVLRCVLATGNTLNSGTHRGNATAIKLESLGKMVDVKVRHVLFNSPCKSIRGVCNTPPSHTCSPSFHDAAVQSVSLLRQVSAPLKGGEAEGEQAARTAADVNGRAAPDANGSVNRSSSVQHPAATAVTTLLEFVAWVVFTELPASARCAGWFKGRGGYLADQLDAVREASVRVQVGPCCRTCCIEHELLLQVGPFQQDLTGQNKQVAM